MTSSMNFLSLLGSKAEVSVSRVFRVLHLCSVVGLDVWVWLMLWFDGCLVLEMCEGLGDIAKY